MSNLFQMEGWKGMGRFKQIDIYILTYILNSPFIFDGYSFKEKRKRDKIPKRQTYNDKQIPLLPPIPDPKSATPGAGGGVMQGGTRKDKK